MNGQKIIRTVYRADQIYTGNATALAPDLIIGYRRGNKKTPEKKTRRQSGSSAAKKR